MSTSRSRRRTALAMTFEVGRCGKAGRLRKLWTPAPRWRVGLESHSGRTCLGPAAARLGWMIAGSGNNGEDGPEGVSCREVYAARLHAPVLSENPWLADHLISRAPRHRNGDRRLAGSLAPSADQAEAEARAAALRLACRPARWWGWPQPSAPCVGGRGRLGETAWLGVELSQRAGGRDGILAERRAA